MMRGYGYGYGPMMNSGTGLFLGFLFFMFGLLVVATIVVLVLWAVRSSRMHGHPAPGQMPGQHPGQAAMPPSTPAGHDEAVAIAKRRFASGEITKDEYDEIIRTLNS